MSQFKFIKNTDGQFISKYEGKRLIFKSGILKTNINITGIFPKDLLLHPCERESPSSSALHNPQRKNNIKIRLLWDHYFVSLSQNPLSDTSPSRPYRDSPPGEFRDHQL